MTYLIQIYHRRFTMPDDYIDGFQHAVLETLRGGFIPIARTVTILVTAPTPIVIEHFSPPAAEDSTDTDADDIAFYDFDHDI